MDCIENKITDALICFGIARLYWEKENEWTTHPILGESGIFFTHFC